MNAKDKEVILSMPRSEISKILDEWVGETHVYVQNDRDWGNLEVMDKYFGDNDQALKSKILKRAYDLH